MKRVLGILMIIGLFGGFIFGQKSKSKTPNPKSSATWEKLWFIEAKISGTFESNFDREPIGTKSVGVIPSFSAGYQLQKDRDRIQFGYALGRPYYSKFNKYNHFGQYFRLAYRRSFGKNWSAETEAELALRSFDEDRQDSNQFILTQKLNYRFMKNNKFSLIGAFRYKSDRDDRNQTARNPQIGLKYTRSLGKNLAAYASFRYDNNLARGLRQRYIRRTFSTGFDFEPTKQDVINVEVRYAPRLYGRLIEVNGVDVPRADQKLTFDANWRHECKSNWGMESGYSYEKRTSNDSDKKYQNHRAVLAIYYRWGSKDLR